MNIAGHNVSATGILPNEWERDGVAHAEPNEAQIEIAERWIALFCTPRKTFNTRIGSYGLKHRVEHWTRTLPAPASRGESFGSEYVSNGAFIVAALRAGYLMRPHGGRSPNASFNLSIRRTSR